jgi:hypothetical protein
MTTLKVEEIFFRDMYRQICLLTKFPLVKEERWRGMFDLTDEKLDGLLTYAYIDETASFTFETLAGAQVAGGRLKTFPANYKKYVKLKRSEVNVAELKILTTEYSLAFRDRIKIIEDRISDEVKEPTRFIKNLDLFRHPDYPDDVVVYFFSAEHKPELLWVRCLSVDENILTGELLNEPTENFGCHAGDKIKFGDAQMGEQNILIWLPTK